MAANQTQPTKVSVTEFIDAIADEGKRADAKALVRLMKKASGEKAVMWGPAIIGFGAYHYVYESGREGDMPLVGFAPRKAATVLYNLKSFEGGEEMLATLGKHTTGKGCVYIKRLRDVDTAVLEAMLVKSVEAMRAQHAT